MSIAMSIFSLLGTFVIAFSMLPQTIMTLKLKDTAKLSLPLYFVMGVATFLIFIYGIALCVVPNPAWVPQYNLQQKEIFNQIFGSVGTGSFPEQQHFDVIKSSRAEWISGFVVPGAAVIFGEIFCSVTSFMIAAVKIQNMIKSKQENVSEEEYVQKHYGAIIQQHAEEMNNKMTLKEKLHHEMKGAN